MVSVSFWYDSNTENGPDYEWIDISAEGTLLDFSHNDSACDPIPLDFTFEFYGEEYESVYC